jgi:hypothetical protein
VFNITFVSNRKIFQSKKIIFKRNIPQSKLSLTALTRRGFAERKKITKWKKMKADLLLLSFLRLSRKSHLLTER